MSNFNEVWINTGQQLERLDLDEGAAPLLPTFAANDRTAPDKITSSYSPEFSAPGTARNHRLLSHAATAHTTDRAAYRKVRAVLTSGGVEIMPKALLYIKGYSEGKYQLQLFSGNIDFVKTIVDKMLSDLDFSRFNHAWNPANIATRLPYPFYSQNGYGYELFDRGKPINLEAVDPYTLYPSVAASLILDQIISEAGFTADSLLGEPLFAALSVPSANPYTFSQDFRDARELVAGFEYYPAGNTSGGRVSDGQFHEAEFSAERLRFEYITLAPFHPPTAGASYVLGQTYTADTLGYYDIKISVPVRYGCRGEFFGQVSCKMMIYINGQPVFDGSGNQIGVDEHRIIDNSETDSGGGYMTRVFTAKLERWRLSPTDRVEVFWQGDEWRTGPFNAWPTDPYWNIGPRGGTLVTLPNGNILQTAARFQVEMLEEFPAGGLVRLQDWLPDMKQLDFVKSIMLFLGLTIQTDNYRQHLHLATGSKLLENTPLALDWTAKRDAFSQPGRIPERDLAYRFGDYGQVNYLKWTKDENVAEGYGSGLISVADEILPSEYTMAELPFAATEASVKQPDLLSILNYKASDFTVVPPTYDDIEAKPRIVLHDASNVLTGQLIMSPAYQDGSGTTIPAILASFTTTASYFAGVEISLMLNSTVLTEYWADLRAMLDQSRYLTERYRLTARDIAELDFSRPIWDGILGDFFAISVVSEFSANFSTEVQLVRINAKHLPPPVVPGEDGLEWDGSEFAGQEFY